MNTKDIKQLIEILETSGFEELNYKTDGFEIKLKKPSVVVQSAPVTVSQPALIKPSASTENAVKSPLVGVYYAKPSPEASDFVRIGDSVSQGDVLCIIEAMKVMNEIKAPQSGVVKEIMIQEGDTVDFDQPLFVIE